MPTLECEKKETKRGGKRHKKKVKKKGGWKGPCVTKARAFSSMVFFPFLHTTNSRVWVVFGFNSQRNSLQKS
jgi:hypothetical protein